MKKRGVRQPDPSQEEIQERTAEIRKTWSIYQHYNRAGYPKRKQAGIRAIELPPELRHFDIGTS